MRQGRMDHLMPTPQRSQSEGFPGPPVGLHIVDAGHNPIPTEKQPPPPPSGAEFLGAPKTPKKIFGLNYLATKAPQKISDWRRARKKIWPTHVGGGGGARWVGGGETPPTTPDPQQCWVVKWSPGQKAGSVAIDNTRRWGRGNQHLASFGGNRNGGV